MQIDSLKWKRYIYYLNRLLNPLFLLHYIQHELSK